MMLKLTLAAAALTAAATVQASPPAADATGASLGAAKPFVAKSAESAAPNQLFPPLPSLSSLPQSGTEDAEESAGPGTSVSHRGKKGRRAAPPRKVVETTVRVVVSDASHAYLADVDHQLDQALQGTAREVRGPAGSAGAVAVAMSR
jgi:hypothetical protein